MRKYFNLQLFAEGDGMTKKADLEPAISIDVTSRISENIKELQRILGVTTMTPMAAGTLVKMYRMKAGELAAQVGEGEKIGLTNVKRELANTVELTLKKYRRETTAEAIQKVGRRIAINDADDRLIGSIRKDIKKTFYTELAKGTGKAEGTNLQSGLALGWSALKDRYEAEDLDITPIYFVSTKDIAKYLSNAAITMQTAFGFDYVENFLGLGTVVTTPSIPEGTAYATAKENLNAAYVPAGSGDVAQSFSLTTDSTGLIGMTHSANTEKATIDTMILSGVIFFPEYLDGVIKITTKGA